MNTPTHRMIKFGAALLVLTLLAACDNGGSGGSSSTAPAATGSTSGGPSGGTSGSAGSGSTGSSGSATPPPAQALVAPQLVTPIPNQVFFVAGTENIDFEWTLVPGATHYIFELDGTQHGGTVTKATVNLGIGAHTWRVWGLVNGQDGPKSETSTFTLESMFASP